MIWPIRWTIYLAGLAQGVFIVLKLCGTIQWHWLLVLIPLGFLIIVISLLAWIMYNLS
jgi:hypothetical protein